MAGAISAYKHYNCEEIFTINSQTDQFDFDPEGKLFWLLIHSVDKKREKNSEIPVDWRLLSDQVCSENDLHRIEYMRHASSINECIAQCYGFWTDSFYLEPFELLFYF